MDLIYPDCIKVHQVNLYIVYHSISMKTIHHIILINSLSNNRVTNGGGDRERFRKKFGFKTKTHYYIKGHIIYSGPRIK